MPERVAVGRIIVGQDKERKVIQPGQRFDTGEYGIDEETLKKWDANRTTREPRDEARAGDSPRARSRAGQVVEGRSGPATQVTNPTAQEAAGEARIIREATDNRDMLPGRGEAPAAAETRPSRQGQEEARTTRRERNTDL